MDEYDTLFGRVLLAWILILATIVAVWWRRPDDETGGK